MGQRKSRDTSQPSAVKKTSAKKTAIRAQGTRDVTALKTTRTTKKVVAKVEGVGWQPAARANHVVEVLGNRRAAMLLGVSESQPSRWRQADEVPSSRVAPLLVDLDHIVARLQLIWAEDVIGDWLEGANAFLDGARPIEVLRVNGSGPVLEAIEAEAAGTYA